LFFIFYNNNLFNKIIMGRIGDIETKSLSARVPMETYIHFLATASKNKQTISSYLCDVLINVSANRKPQPFENGGEIQARILEARDSAFASDNRLRKTIAGHNKTISEQQEHIAELKSHITKVESENIKLHQRQENSVLKSEILLYITCPRAKGGEVKLMGDRALMDKMLISIATEMNKWLEKNNCVINAIK
jgi:hypothetical protein